MTDHGDSYSFKNGFPDKERKTTQVDPNSADKHTRRGSQPTNTKLITLVRPERPIGYSHQNWARPEDYERAMTAYYNALAIYEMLGGE